ncbi:MAG: RDD family protein [Cyanobacteria bacterium P01_C01_bin.89]
MGDRRPPRYRQDYQDGYRDDYRDGYQDDYRDDYGDSYGDDYGDGARDRPQRSRIRDGYERDNNELSYIPRAPVWRRGVATAIDGIGCWSLGSMLGPASHVVLFVVLWWLLRVAMVANNRGQSLGRLAMNIKVIEGQDFNYADGDQGRYGRRAPRVPTLLELTKREAILCGELLLGFISLDLIARINPAALLTASPLVADYVVAYLDEERRQAIHDRVIDSIVVQTRRGFSLHIKGRRWFAQLLDQSERFMRK